MQTQQTENTLIIRETPGCLWIVGLFFALVGGVFVYGSLGGLADYDRHAPWLLAATFVMGATGVATGVWIIYRAPVTRVVINRIENSVSMTRYGLYGRQQNFYAFDDIEQFFLIEETDEEGDPIWSLGMNLTNGDVINISSLPSHDERFIQNFVFQTNDFMRRQIASCELILEPADERDAEMS